MNYECNVVSDLLPSYVEKLLSKETEKYIENHVSSCESCREKLQIMQEQYLDNKKNSEEEDKIEFDFLKKVKKKNQIFKIITIIFFIIIIANIILAYVKFNKITNILNESKISLQKYKEQENYSFSKENYQLDLTTQKELYNYTKYYYKDGMYKEEHNTESVNQTILNGNWTEYGKINTKNRITIYHNTNEYYKVETNYIVKSKEDPMEWSTSFSVLKTDFNPIAKVCHDMNLKIRNDRYNGKECIVIRDDWKSGYNETWIDRETKLPIREISEKYNESYNEIFISFYSGNVTDEDVAVPDENNYLVKNVEDILDEKELEIYNEIYNIMNERNGVK